MVTRKLKGQPIHVITQGRPVSGLKSIGAKQAKSAATRTKKPTMSNPPWKQERQNEKAPSRPTNASPATEKAPNVAKVQNQHSSKK